jgi:hypothetical protein
LIAEKLFSTASQFLPISSFSSSQTLIIPVRLRVGMQARQGKQARLLASFADDVSANILERNVPRILGERFFSFAQFQPRQICPSRMEIEYVTTRAASSMCGFTTEQPVRRPPGCHQTNFVMRCLSPPPSFSTSPLC